MGRRRRRKVIRIPKKRLPKFFDCPECGKPKSIKVNISLAEWTITAICGECNNEDIAKLSKKLTILYCSKCDREIVRVKFDEPNSLIAIECSKCNGKNFFKVSATDVLKTPFNCLCDPMKQGKLTISPPGKFAEVACGSCGLRSFFKPKPTDAPVDVYASFIDRYYGKG